MEYKENRAESVSPTRLRHVALLRHSQSKFGVLSVMMDELASALTRAGVRVSVIDRVEARSITEKVEKLAPDCTWAVNPFAELTRVTPAAPDAV